MAWMLQPHDYTQIVRRNLYSMPYRRTGAYKGMGQAGSQDLSWLPDLGPVPSPPPLTSTGTYMTSAGPVNVSDGVYMGSTYPGSPVGYGAPATGSTTSMAWLPWVIGGVLVLGLIAGGRR